MAVLALIVEANSGEGLDDLSLSGLDARVADNELQNSGVLLAIIDIVLDVERANFFRGRETLNPSIGDGTHESGLVFK